MTLEFYSVAKRALDVGGSLLLLIGLAPVLCVLLAWIWWDDGRPLFFTQVRAGQHGVPFRILKLRTLSAPPDDPSRAVSYATRSGRFLRRWALDEIPQLWNVLRGDMSLVGPRPPLLDDLQQYDPRERMRLQVRPGLTGWAQIHGRNALPWAERIDHDVWYVRNRSFLLDLKVLAQTPRVLLHGQGVYGRDGRNPSFSSSPSDHA